MIRAIMEFLITLENGMLVRKRCLKLSQSNDSLWGLHTENRRIKKDERDCFGLSALSCFFFARAFFNLMKILKYLYEKKKENS